MVSPLSSLQLFHLYNVTSMGNILTILYAPGKVLEVNY
jgi:hypothetical protein